MIFPTHSPDYCITCGRCSSPTQKQTTKPFLSVEFHPLLVANISFHSCVISGSLFINNNKWRLERRSDIFKSKISVIHFAFSVSLSIEEQINLPLVMTKQEATFSLYYFLPLLLVIITLRELSAVCVVHPLFVVFLYETVLPNTGFDSGRWFSC